VERSRRSALATLAFVALLVLVALGIRWLPVRAAFQPDRIYFYGADPYDHMRRVFLAAKDFPTVPGVDFYQGYPVGTPNRWPPLLHLAIAGAALLASGGKAEPRTVETVGAAAPTLLGALCLIPVFLLGRQLGGRRTGLLAAGFLAVMPAHVWQTMVGRVDNNAAEPLLAASFLCAVACALPERWRRGEGESRLAGLWPALLAGVTVWVALFTWRGAELFLFVAMLYAGAELFTAPWRSCDPRPAARAVGMAALVLAAGTAPFVAAGAWSARPVFLYGVISWFHVATAGGGGAVLVALSRAPLRRLRTPGTRRLALAAAAVVLATGLAWLVDPGRFGAQGVALYQRLVSQSGLWGSVEYQPLTRPFERLTWAFAAAPLIWAGLALREGRGGFARPRWNLFLTWSAAFLGLTVLRVRFAAWATLALALLAAIAADALARRLQARRPGLGVAGSTLVSVCLAVVLLGPGLRAVAELPHKSFKFPVTDDLFSVLDWMRTSTPRTSHYFEPWQRPEYGVLAAWDYGSWVGYVGRRPAVATPWGDETYGLEPLTRFYLTESLAEADEILVSDDIRYVIVSNALPQLAELARMAGRSPADYLEAVAGVDGAEQNVPGPAFARLVSTRLLYNDGRSLLRPAREDPPPAHLRLVYESPTHLEVPGFRKTVPLLKVFERVAGALVRGRTQPGAPVTADLVLVTNQGRRFRWRSATRADAAGRFALRLPYATDARAGAVRTQGLYRFAAGGRARPLGVSEEEVQRGAELLFNP
jgi:asparagine N-glycosylation enzyme membrane subunit Stt3